MCKASLCGIPRLPCQSDLQNRTFVLHYTRNAAPRTLTKDICKQTAIWHHQKTLQIVQMLQLAGIREQETNGTEGCPSRTN